MQTIEVHSIIILGAAGVRVAAIAVAPTVARPNFLAPSEIWLGNHSRDQVWRAAVAWAVRRSA
jgi:hypothetical protein